MMRGRWLAVCAVSMLLAASAYGDKFILKRKYLVAQPNATAPISVTAIQNMGGLVSLDAVDRLLIDVPAAIADVLRQHPSVNFLQPIVSGPDPVRTSEQRSAAASRGPVGDAPAVTYSALESPGGYVYDGSGNITNIGANTYGYDALSRVTSANVRGINVSYTYDAFGNMVTATTNGTTLTFNTYSGYNRLADAATYDTAGNLAYLNWSDAKNSYDPFNNLRQQIATANNEYVYDADDERVGIHRVNGGMPYDWTWTLRDESGKVLRVYEGANGTGNPSTWTWVEDYAYRDGQLLGAEREDAEGGRRHFHLDHLGTVRLVTADDGERIASHEYYPFGVEATALRQETLIGYDQEDPMKFTGHERDFTMGTNVENTVYQDYMHARYYDPARGRFLSVDPGLDLNRTIHDPQLWNRYSYVRNNPVGNTDPNGKFCVPCAAVGAFVAVGYESYRQVTSGAPVDNPRLLAALGLGAVAGATLGTAAEVAPIAYNTLLANPAAVATGTAVVGAALGVDTPQTPITKSSVIEGFAVSNHAWRKSGLGRGATEEMVAGVIKGARAAGTVIEEVGTGKFEGNAIRVYVNQGVKVVVDETRNIIMSIRSTDPKQFKLPQ